MHWNEYIIQILAASNTNWNYLDKKTIIRIIYMCLFRSDIHAGFMQTTGSDRGRWYGTKRPKASMIHYVHLFSSSRRLIPIQWEPNQRFVLSTYRKHQKSYESWQTGPVLGVPKISAILPKYPIFEGFFHVFMGKKSRKLWPGHVLFCLAAHCAIMPIDSVV